MNFTITRETLLKPLQLVAGVVERRQTMPIMANVLVVVDGNQLILTATNGEIEIVVNLSLEGDSLSDGEITVPARKFLDVCRVLSDNAELHFSLEEEKVILKSGRSRFTLLTMPAVNFPAIETQANDIEFICPQKEIKYLIERTSFAMAQQDVRYYLNGMLLELSSGSLRVVTTDGHRLAMCTRPLEVEFEEVRQAILPRKGVMELARLLDEPDSSVTFSLGTTHLRARTNTITFTTKLVDGKFPDYQRVLPKQCEKVIYGQREELREAFARTAVLSNEKIRGVRLMFEPGLLTLAANNPEQDEALDQVAIEYDDEPFELGFNASYLLDVANILQSEKIKISLTASNASALLEEPDGADSAYVVMPMRL